MPHTLDGIVLLGWLEKADAISFLHNHCWFDPQLTYQQAEAVWQPFRSAVEQLPERKVLPPTRLPIPQANRAWVNQFLNRTRCPEILDVINIDPRTLIIHQFYVAVDRAAQHAQNIGNNHWTQTCLQIDRPAAQLPIRMEGNIVKVSVPHGEHILALNGGTFQIQQGGGYISVCEIEGRMLLKAGYHRSFAFVRSITNELEAKDTSLLVALTATAPPQLSPQFPTQGLRTTVLGSRPPLFSDFFNEALAMKVKLRRKKYEYHIHFEQVDDL
jgi:hypothetical protein